MMHYFHNVKVFPEAQFKQNNANESTINQNLKRWYLFYSIFGFIMVLIFPTKFSQKFYIGPQKCKCQLGREDQKTTLKLGFKTSGTLIMMITDSFTGFHFT